MKNKFKTEVWIIAFVILMFAAVSFMSLTSIQQQHGNARVVNYIGIVRGATQKLVKEELRGEPDDKLVTRLDGIVQELSYGGDINDLVALPDPSFKSNMAQIRESWNQLKEQIRVVRTGGDDMALYNQSQIYFDLANDTVFKAESYSESQVARSKNILIGFNIAFMVILVTGLIYFSRMRTMRRRAELLSKIAYVDVLTNLPNRAQCEQVCKQHDAEKPVGNLAVFMFDMNNLKTVNDKFGHQTGDKIIQAFAGVLKTWAEGKGFVGRYGGDEFLAVFDNADSKKAEEYTAQLAAMVEEYNRKQTSLLEKVSYAVGCRVDNLSISDMEMMILDADRNMYERKRQMKEAMLD